MGLALALEDFEIAPAVFAASPEPDGPSPDWYAGHAAGRAEAAATAAAAQDALDTAFVQRLEDMAFGHAEARSLLMAELVPLFETLSSTLLPALADDVLAAHLVDALEAAARDDLGQKIVLRVSSRDVVAISDRLAAYDRLPFVCRSDPALPPGSVILSGGTFESCLDTARLTDGLGAILSAFIDDQPLEAAHG